MDYISTLPHEVLHNILRDVEPEDLAWLPLCCKALNVFITDNRPLFRDVYLAKLDEPPEQPNCVDYDWIGGIKRYVKMNNILGHGAKGETNYQRMSVREKTQKLPFVTDVVSSWMRTASPPHRSQSLNVKVLTDYFQSRDNREAFFCNSTIFARARKDTASLCNSSPVSCLFPGVRHISARLHDDARSGSESPVDEEPESPWEAPSPVIICKEDRQLSAKLHTMYGVPIELPSRRKFKHVYPYACSVLYDLRNYTEGNKWGPYKSDNLCTVDWERLEAIMIVLGHNMKMFTENSRGIIKPLWAEPWLGASPDSFMRAKSPTLLEQPTPPLEMMDPYNVGGTWMRVVCFLDFSELFAYNFNTQAPEPGEPRRPIDTTEAIRLIIMEITVDRISEPEEDDGQDLPIVHFKGFSRSMHSQWDPSANSNIKGSVRMTQEGEVRWTSISSYQGEERWKSEGIQVGGIRSARGVLGHWFDKDHDRHGPAGPTAFWKVSNEIDDSESDAGDADDEGDDEDYEEGDDEADFNVEDLNMEQVVAILGAIGGTGT